MSQHDDDTADDLLVALREDSQEALAVAVELMAALRTSDEAQRRVSALRAVMAADRLMRTDEARAAR